MLGHISYSIPSTIDLIWLESITYVFHTKYILFDTANIPLSSSTCKITSIHSNTIIPGVQLCPSKPELSHFEWLY